MKRKPGRPRKGKGSVLSRERIVEAAHALVGEAGLEELSLRALAKRLRCEPMSLYHHFPSKAHLLDAMLDHVVAGMKLGPAERPFRARLETAVRGYRERAVKFPRFFPFMAVHRMNTPTGLAYLESVARIFTDAGFPPEQAALHFRVLSYFLTGAVLDEALGYDNGPSAAEPVPPGEQARLVPTLAAMSSHFTNAFQERVFSAGLGLLVDEIARQQPPKENPS